MRTGGGCKQINKNIKKILILCYFLRHKREKRMKKRFVFWRYVFGEAGQQGKTRMCGSMLYLCWYLFFYFLFFELCLPEKVKNRKKRKKKWERNKKKVRSHMIKNCRGSQREFLSETFAFRQLWQPHTIVKRKFNASIKGKNPRKRGKKQKKIIIIKKRWSGKKWGFPQRPWDTSFFSFIFAMEILAYVNKSKGYGLTVN